MEALKVHQAGLLSEISKSCERLEAALQAELLTRDEARETEHDRQLRQLEELQERSATAEGLEEANQKLKSELNLLRSRLEEQPRGVDVETHNFVKSQLAERDNDYGKAVRARDILESKCRRYKEIQQEWRKYCQEWILKHHTRELSRAPQRASRQVLNQPREAEWSRSSSAPAPPACLTPTSFSDVSRSNTPRLPSPLPSVNQIQNADSKIIDPTSRVVSNHTVGEIDTFHPTTGVESSAPPETPTTDDSGNKSTPAQKGPSAELNETHPQKGVQGFKSKEDDDDDPVFVSAKSLKRRRALGDERGDLPSNEDQEISGSKSRSDVVKAEELSSSLLQPTGKPKALDRMEDSLDLDEVGGTVDTPRKKQRLQQNQRGSRLASSIVSQSDEDAVTHASLDADCPSQENNSAADIKYEEECEQTRFFDDLFEDNPRFPRPKRQISHLKDDEPLKGKTVGRVAKQNAHNKREHGSENASKPLTDCQTLQTDKPDALHVKDPNILPRTNDPKDKRHCPPSRRDRGAAQVPALAEDGEEHTPVKGARQPEVYHRLSNLMSEPHPTAASCLDRPNAYQSSETTVKTPFAKFRRPNDALRPTSLSDSHSMSKIQASSMETPSTKQPKIVYKAGSKTVQPTARFAENRPILRKIPEIKQKKSQELDPDDEPFRARPIHRLRLEDFKLNSKHSEFAYHESVRKHDDKKRLHGCIDPFCERCKDFQKFVESSEYAAQPKQGIFDSSSPDTATAEQRILEEYMGEQKHRLRKMPKQDRDTLLIRAKMEKVTDAFGRHRQAFPRAKSPPGFWDTGFPSTQEQLENDEAAKKIARQKVEERYYEAVRGGVWKFADE